MTTRLSIHLTAIGGVGMTALAGLLTELGHRVRGSDLDVYPPASDELARLGVTAARGYRAENLVPRPDLVVMGNAISANNPEAIAARTQGIPTVSLPEALANFCLQDRTPLVVAGTHGKTTSASFLAWVLRRAGREPGYFIGGSPIDLRCGYALGHGAEFVLEGDEYDTAYFDKGPKFLHYRPQGLLLTSVEFDHADIYRDLEHVKSSFTRLVALLPPDGPVVVCSDFPHARDVVAAAGRRAISFSGSFTSSPPADWRIEGLEDSASGLRFVAVGPGERFPITTPLLGMMNARNVLGIAVLARAIGVSVIDVQSAAATFHGVRRRQQIVVRGPITVIDDFAHHPTAISATLAAVRGRYPEGRLWALFDPRSNTSRRRIFQDDIASALAEADHVVIGPVHRADQLDVADRFSPSEAVALISGRGRSAIAESDTEAIVARLAKEAAPGDVVVAMSNGAFGGLVGRLAQVLGAGA